MHPFNAIYNTPSHPYVKCVVHTEYACADPESFVRGGPTLRGFWGFFRERKKMTSEKSSENA